MTEIAAAVGLNVPKEPRELAAVAIAVAQLQPSKIASMGGGSVDAAVFVVAEVAADGSEVAAASTLVAVPVVAAGELAELVPAGEVDASTARAAADAGATAVAAAVIDEVDEDYVQVGAAVVGSAGPHQQGSYHLNCCTGAQWEGLEWEVSQA